MANYEYLDEEAIADVAFRAWGENPSELFYWAGMATANLQTDLDMLQNTKSEKFTIENADIERLLKKFLDEILYFKDADLFFVKDIKVNVEYSGDKWIAQVIFHGDTFDFEKYPMHNDLKAITWHDFSVKQVNNRWECYVLIDI